MFGKLKNLFTKEEVKTPLSLNEKVKEINDDNYFKEYDANLVMEIYSELEKEHTLGTVVQITPYLYSMMVDDIEFHITEDGMGRFVNGAVIIDKTSEEASWEKIGELPPMPL
jgi:hypothetical protein